MKKDKMDLIEKIHLEIKSEDLGLDPNSDEFNNYQTVIEE